MKILVLSTWYPFPPDNGSRIRAYELLRALERQHEVSLIAFQPHGREEAGVASEAEFERLQVHAVNVDPYRYVGVRQTLKYLSPIPVAFWPSRLMRQTVTLVGGLAHWDAAVAIQVPVARYALQMGDVPCLLDLDTALSYQMHRRYASETHPVSRARAWISCKKAEAYERRLCRRFDVCMVASGSELKHTWSLVHGSECRVDIVPNGVDCQHNHPGLAQASPNALVFNGALSYSANYDAMKYYLAEIHQHILEQEPKVTLTITGSTSGVDLRGLQLQDSVNFSGYVSDIRPLVAGAQICLAPIRQGGGTRLKILESMALGTAVVSTSKGAEGLEVAPERDILIADEPGDFAAQVLRLLRDAELRAYLARNARRLVEERYDWQAIGQQFVRLVEAVAEEKRDE